MGVIYKIENKVNGKVYIGQTIGQFKTRIENHISSFRNYRDCKPGSLYYDMWLYGVDSFEFQVIEQCDNDKLSEREIYYIKMYDSFNSGYNKTRGGSTYIKQNSALRVRVQELIEQGMSATEIAQTVGSQLQFVRNVAKSRDLEIVKKQSGDRLKVIRFDDQYNRIGRFDSISEAYRKCEDIHVSESQFQHNIRTACGTGNLMYNSYWALERDLKVIIDGKEYEFNSPLDKLNYSNGAEFSIENGVVTVNDKHSINKNKRCKFCDKEVDGNIEICAECAEEHKRSYLSYEYRRKCGLLNKPQQVKQIRLNRMRRVKSTKVDKLPKEQKPPKEKKPLLRDRLPDKETLRELMKSHTYRDIANMYGVYERTLREVLREYGIYEEKIARDVNEKQLAIDILQIGLDKAAVKHKVQKWKATRVANDFEIEAWMYDNTKPVCAVSMIDGAKTIFGQLKDAARALSSADASTSQINSLAYRIGQHMKQNTQYYDCMWYYIDKSQVIADMINKINNT